MRVPTNTASQPVLRRAAPLREQVVQALRADIAGARLAPGERLLERELCDRFGVSRTCVREALRSLEAEGLIVLVPNAGPRVATVSVTEAIAIYQLRAALEGLAASLFTTLARDDEIERLGRLVDEMERAAGTGDVPAVLAVKDEFFRALIAGSGNPELSVGLERIHTRTTALRRLSLARPGRLTESVREIRALHEAVRARNPRTAWRAAGRHVVGAAAAALSAIESDAGRLESSIDAVSAALPV